LFAGLFVVQFIRHFLCNELYRPFGFETPKKPQNYMEIRRDSIHKNLKEK